MVTLIIVCLGGNMKQFAYSAVCYADIENETKTLLLPDLDIIASGSDVEDAFWSAKKHLESFVDLSIKFGDEILPASTFEEIARLNPKKAVILVDAKTDAELADVEAAEQRFQNFLRDYFE